MAEEPDIDGIEEEEAGVAIAIVGMAGRFPGAAGVGELWQNICDGRSGITHFSEEELRAAGVSQELLDDPDYVRAGAVVDGIEEFDADFFGIGATEAQALDPQHRLFMEHCWEALEDAGCDPARFDGTIGVFAGCAISSYMNNNLAGSEVVARLGELAVGLGNDKDSLTTRTAHTLGLGGPSYAIQSYCSTSLVAVCAAASSLAAYESDLMLAGGAAISVPHRVGYLYQPGGITPPDGECRAFDAAGLGAPLGNGVAVVALRRLEDALEHGDRIYAVIRGWATNNDAGRKVGFTAPGVQGQAAVIEEALASCGLTAAEIDYVEAHGTGTALGDAVELSALQQVFDGESVRIGSVKTNVGHLDRAAGVTNLIKASLALQAREIPPTRNLSKPNEQLSAGNADIEVVTTRIPWPTEEGRVRRAGVSSFGIGGTNAHVIIEEAPQPKGDGAEERPELLVWSARSAAAADTMTSRLAEHEHGLGRRDHHISNIAYTLQTGRRVFEHRRMLVVPPGEDAAKALRDRGPLVGTEARTDREIAFLIAGTGEQYPGMISALYRAEPVFASVLDECREALARHLDGEDPLAAMLRDRAPANSTGSMLSWLLNRGPEAAAVDPDKSTIRVQPAVFAVQYALARLLRSWGIGPSVMAGYSVGEYVAACLSGVLTLPDALALVAHRAKLINALPAGAMAAVPLSAADLHRRVEEAGIEGVDTAAVNSPELTVISGSPETMNAVRTALGVDAIPCRPLATSHAFHSAMLEPVAAELTDWVAANITPHKPEIPYLSNVTGELITEEQVLDPGYWAQHMCAPVQFDTMLGELLKAEDTALLELGPGQSLGAMVRGRPDCPPSRWPLVVSTLPSETDQTSADVLLTEALGRLWLLGVPVDWTGYQQDRPVAKVQLPTYPFERKRYWIEPSTAPRASAAPQAPAERRVELLAPQWTPSPSATTSAPTRCVLLADRTGVAEALASALRESGVDVHIGAKPTSNAVVVDLRLLDSDADGGEVVAEVAATVDAWAEAGASVVLVTRGGQAVTDDERPGVAHAAVAAVAVVANQEYPDLSCRTVDVDPADDPVTVLHAELLRGADDILTAYRGGQRYVPDYQPAESGSGAPAVREGGTYLITGGLGGVGLTVARHFADAGAGTLILTSRRGLPDGDERVADLRAAGVRVLTPAVDVTDEAAMRAVFAETDRLDGVVHAAAATGFDTFGPLADTDVASATVHFDAKVGGALVLQRLLDEHPADFCVLFSSTAAILGGITFGSYAASNAALSAVGQHNHARHRAGETPTRWITGCWDPWANTVTDLDSGSSMGAELARLAMTEPEALGAFDSLLSADGGCRVVTVAGVADRLPTASRTEATPAPSGDRFPRPQLPQPYLPPATDTERTVAELWSSVLGVEPVGAADAFFDLGGNSLLSLQMTGMIKKRFGASVPSVALLEAPTVRAFAAMLEEHGVVAAPVEPAKPEAVPAPRSSAPMTAFLPSWRPRPMALDDLDGRLRAAGPWLLLVDDVRGEQLARRLNLAGAEVVAVRPGEILEAEPTGDFRLPVGGEAELVRSQVVAPRTVVHAFSLGSGDAMRSVLSLVDALDSADLVVLTSGAIGVLGPDADHPSQGALAGLAGAALGCRHVDVDAQPAAEQTLAAIIGEASTCAIRAGGTWLRHHEPLPTNRTRLSAKDTVLITDGLGEAGKPIARHLAQTYGCRLVLTTGCTLPPRADWPQLTADDPATALVAEVRDLEEAGATVRLVSADLGDEHQLRAAIGDGIDVAIHAAEQVPAQPATAAQAAVHGFDVLDKVLTGQAPRRLVVLTPETGGCRRSRIAANAALSAHAAAARLAGRGPWVSVEPAPWLTNPGPAETVAMVERALAAEHVAAVVVGPQTATDPITTTRAPVCPGGAR